MNTTFRKLATVSATAAIALQLFAGASLAAKPTATATSTSYGTYGGDGNAGFTTTFTFDDTSTLSKLYLEARVTGGASIVPSLLNATRGTQNVTEDCSIQATPLAVTCVFKSVRGGERITVTYGVLPAAAATAVTTQGVWSTTGFGSGSGDNSHGDDWPAPAQTASRNGSDDFAAGFGNTTLETKLANNKQAAKLTGLPAAKYASVNDNGSGTFFGFPQIDLTVNNGAAANFQLVITYPKNTKSPNSYIHFASTGYPDTEYFLCKNGQPQVNCFTWSKQTYSATLYLAHNGSLRRTS